MRGAEGRGEKIVVAVLVEGLVVLRDNPRRLFDGPTGGDFR